MLYKLTHEQAPQYLQDILTPHINNPDVNPYPLRQTRLFNPPICRTNNYFDSFIPSMCRTANTNDKTLLESNTLQNFKLQLDKNKIHEMESVKIFKNEGDRRANIVLTQLRNKCSDLNFDLHNDHLKDSPECTCTNNLETVSHFFQECPLYNDLRNNLFNFLDNCAANHNHTSMETLVNGCLNCDGNTNKLMLHQIHYYIGKSNRFNLFKI